MHATPRSLSRWLSKPRLPPQGMTLSTPSICPSQLSVVRERLSESDHARAAFQQPRLDAFASVMGNAMLRQLGQARCWAVDQFTASHESLWHALSVIEQQLEPSQKTRVHDVRDTVNECLNDALKQCSSDLEDELKHIRTMPHEDREANLRTWGSKQGIELDDQ
jgi:hypothetical protein